MLESQPGEREAILDFTPQAPAARDAAPADEPAGIVRQGVRIGDLRLLFDFASTSQLSELVPITPLPATPRWLLGLASLHGIVLPVFDLAALAGVERSSSRKTLLLVIGHGESAAAVLIEGLPDRFHFLESERVGDWRAQAWLADCVAAAYQRDNETWLDIDHQGLLGRFEQSLSAPG